MNSSQNPRVAQRVIHDLRQAIGDTPLYLTHSLNLGNGVEAYLKLEYFNPGGSIKDRTALGMIERAEREGKLRSGTTIIESSSGNTAIGLSMLARACGYRVVAICDRHLPATKRARLTAFGAQTVFLPQTPPGMDTVELRIALANYLAERVPNSITLGQYSNLANVDAHFRTTGPEIISALDGKLDVVVVAVGTCGTISGVGRAIKSYDRRIQVVGVEPHGSIIFGGCDATYYIQGGGLSFIPSILDRSVIDYGLQISDEDAIAAAHELGRSEGIMVGGTGGLVIRAIQQLGKDMAPGQRIVGIIPDAGDRYLDTLFDDQWLSRHNFAALTTFENQGQNELQQEVGRVGCTINHVPDWSGPSLHELCTRLGVPIPDIVQANRMMRA